ncbi:MAG: DNA-processing protein DprA [Myxococcota bacterium]
MDEEVVARVELAGLSGLGRAQAQHLIDRFGSARAVLRASPKARAAWLSPALGERLEAALRAPVARQRLADAAARGIRALAPGAAEFPAVLASIPDPPLVVWARGPLRAGPALAMVGARRASSRALVCARGFAAEIAKARIAVISGLAYGVDAAAHEGALDGRGHTVAVLASGLDQVTPRGQRKLAERILDAGGAWLSEHPPGEGAHPHHFPERNRLISGLASATLIVEARERSGSLWTARHALEQGRDVLVVPGPIDSELCRGTNRLLRDGATPILEPADAIEAVLGPLARRTEPPEPAAGDAAPPSDPARALLALLADGPRDLDAIARALGRSPAELSGLLLELELTGLVQRVGARVARTRPG